MASKKTLLTLAYLFLACPLVASVLEFEKKLFPADYEAFGRFFISRDRILASTNSSVLVYDKSGRLLGRIGRKGQGPGEFNDIRDFVVIEDRLIVADYHRKIAIFDKAGHLERELRAKNNIHSVMSIKGRLFYIGIVKKNDGKRTHDILSVLRLEDEKEIVSFPDDTMTYAVHANGKRPAFPWFPAPFPNRIVVSRKGNGGIDIFQTRCAYFMSIDDIKADKIDIAYGFREEPTVKSDRENFFRHIESVNKTEYPPRTRDSIQFPAKRELFLGAIPWSDGTALIDVDHLIVLSPEGRFMERVDFPEEIEVGDRLEFTSPELRMQRQEDKLYFYDQDEGSLKIFAIVSDQADSLDPVTLRERDLREPCLDQ